MISIEWPPPYSARVKWPPVHSGAVVWPPPYCARISVDFGASAVPSDLSEYFVSDGQGSFVQANAIDVQLFVSGPDGGGVYPYTEFYVSDGAGGFILAVDLDGQDLYVTGKSGGATIGAVTFDGEVVTFDGEPVTWQGV